MGLLAEYIMHNVRSNRQDELYQRQQDDLSTLVGQERFEVPGVMGDMSGLYNEGSGLMGGAGMNDPTNRMKFATGLMGIGLQGAGATMMNQQYQQRQQGGQFDQTFNQNQEQLDQGQENWQQSYDRGINQFDQTLDESKRKTNLNLMQQQQKYDEDRDASNLPQPTTVSERLKVADEQKKGQSLYESAKRSQELAGMLKKFGTENMDYSNDGTASKMRFMREELIDNLRVMRDMGVMQEAEYERLNESLPETDSWLGGLTSSNKSLSQPYIELANLMGAKYQAYLDRMELAKLPAYTPGGR